MIRNQAWWVSGILQLVKLLDVVTPSLIVLVVLLVIIVIGRVRHVGMIVIRIEIIKVVLCDFFLFVMSDFSVFPPSRSLDRSILTLWNIGFSLRHNPSTVMVSPIHVNSIDQHEDCRQILKLHFIITL